MDKLEIMKKIESAVRSCNKCRLYKGAQNAVPGEGNVNAEIAFVGEAPGETEDITGRPFVGRAGKLLEASLAELGYKRNDIWIGNVIKHRPPANRSPLPDEIEVCQKFLEYQLKIISPSLVVTLGRFAFNYFYPEGKISVDRGTMIRSKGFNVYPVYHPAAALRNPTMMRDFRDDFSRIKQALESAKTDVTFSGEAGNANETTGPEETDDGQLVLGL